MEDLLRHRRLVEDDSFGDFVHELEESGQHSLVAFFRELRLSGEACRAIEATVQDPWDLVDMCSLELAELRSDLTDLTDLTRLDEAISKMRDQIEEEHLSEMAAHDRSAKKGG